MTGSQTCVLAEFNYDGVPMETFPVDQSKVRTYIFEAFGETLKAKKKVG